MERKQYPAVATRRACEIWARIRHSNGRIKHNYRREASDVYILGRRRRLLRSAEMNLHRTAIIAYSLNSTWQSYCLGWSNR